MNVLITGGAGYIGSVLVERLLQDYHVTVLDNFTYRQNSLAQFCRYDNFEVICGDVRDSGVLSAALTGADVVIHLAAIVGQPACERDQTTAWTTNYDAVHALCGKLSKEQRLIFPTTNSGYGSSGGQICTETTRQKPISVYGQTKVRAEKRVMEHENAVSLRLATVFGPAARMRLDLLVNDFVFRAVSDHSVVLFEGHFSRNFVHICDVAKAFAHTISFFEEMRGQAYNVGDSRANMTKLALCDVIKTHLPKFLVVEAPTGEDPDKRDYIVSNEKIEAAGWRPEHSLDSGIGELIKLYRMVRPREHRNA